MRYKLLVATLLLLAQLTLAQTGPQIGIREKPSELFAFTNAKIYISAEKVIDSGTLVIDKGLIKAVGKNINIPAGAYITDLSGYTIYPGFIDPYTSFGLPAPPKKTELDYLKFDPDERGAKAPNDAIHSEIDWIDYFNPSKKEADEYIANGYTVVQSAQRDGIFRGRSFVTLVGSDKLNFLPLKAYNAHYLSLDKGSSQQQYPESQMGAIALLRQTFYDRDWYQKAISAWRNNQSQPKPEFNSGIEALGNFSGSYVFETNDYLELLRSDNLAAEFDLDFIHIGRNDEYKFVDGIKQRGISLILPLSFPKKPMINSYADELDYSLEQLRDWETAPYNPAIMEENKIKFCFTSSFLRNPKTFWKNLRLVVQNGLSEQSALAALTSVPAQFCGIDNLCGSLENGKLANFVIADGNLFDENSAIYNVYIKGQPNHQLQIPPYPVTGKFDLTYNNQIFELLISGKPNQLNGKVIIAADTVSLKNISYSHNLIEFNFSHKSIADNQNLLFAGHLTPTGFEGELHIDLNLAGNWLATRLAPEEKEIKKAEPPQRVAEFSYPNKAFGFKTLPQSKNMLIKNVTLWTSEADGIIENCDLLIKDGKIEKYGKDLIADASYEVIDGTGKHLTAGIIDNHSHIAGSGDINECTHNITPEVRIADIINPEDINIYRQLSGGVTASHVLHGSCNAIGGQNQMIKLKWGSGPEALKYNDCPPTIKLALGENIKRSDWGDKFKTRYPVTRMGVEANIRDVFQAALEYEARWKKYSSLGKKEKANTVPPRKDLGLDAVLQTLKMERLVHCHSYVQSEILMIMRLAEDYNFRIQNLTHTLEAYKIADEIAQHGASVCTFSDWWAYKFEVYDAIPYNTALLYNKGVNVCVKSDNADLARRLNLEAAKAIMYGGLAQEDAIKLCTINPAIQMKADDRIGSIKVGKDADFVIWNGNPLSVYSKVEKTFIEGALYFDIDKNNELISANQAEKKRLVEKIMNTK